jgi:hypothetical protein
MKREARSRFHATHDNPAGGCRESCPCECAADPDQTDQQNEKQLCLVKAHIPYERPVFVEISLSTTRYVCFNGTSKHESYGRLTCN